MAVFVGTCQHGQPYISCIECCRLALADEQDRTRELQLQNQGMRMLLEQVACDFHLRHMKKGDTTTPETCEQEPCAKIRRACAENPKGETSMVCLESRPLPAGWDGSPKGCWEQHPETRQICQLPPDGHTAHERDDATGVGLLRWGVEKRKCDSISPDGDACTLHVGHGVGHEGKTLKGVNVAWFC